MRSSVLCAALGVALLPWNVSAQSLALTEAEALARLSADSPRLRAIRAAIDVSRADVIAAGRWPNPRVTFDRESVAGVSEDITTVAQQLPISGRLGLQIRAATALVDATSSRAEEEIRRLRADLRLAFAQLLAAQIRERELTGARDRLDELAKLIAKREAAGDAAGFDRLRAEREVIDVEADRAAAATDLARAQAILAAVLGGETVQTSQVVAVTAVVARAPVPTLEALTSRAESVRGELIALQKEVDAARWSERAAARRLIPDPELAAGTKSSNARGGDVGSVIAVQAVVPLFDRARPERAQARARAAQAQARAEAFRQVLAAEIAAQRAAVVDRREMADRYRAAAIASAEQIERIAQVSYDAGERGILELLDAYRSGATARVRQIALDLAARQAEIELEFVSGWEMP